MGEIWCFLGGNRRTTWLTTSSIHFIYRRLMCAAAAN